MDLRDAVKSESTWDDFEPVKRGVKGAIVEDAREHVDIDGGV
jgi:hypothetical protein